MRIHVTAILSTSKAAVFGRVLVKPTSTFEPDICPLAPSTLTALPITPWGWPDIKDVGFRSSDTL